MQATDQFHAVQSGQLEVGNNDVENPGFGLDQTIVAAARASHTVTFVGQDTAQSRRGAGVVFDQKYLSGGTHLDSNFGRRMPKVVPWFNRVRN